MTDEFTIRDASPSVWVMNISTEGITVNPAFEVDDAAKKVLEAMSDQLAFLMAQARAEQQETDARIVDNLAADFEQRALYGYPLVAKAAQVIRSQK